MEAAPKKLSVSAILLGIIGGRAGNCGSAAWNLLR
jgi:hypothetical protein